MDLLYTYYYIHTTYLHIYYIYTNFNDISINKKLPLNFTYNQKNYRRGQNQRAKTTTQLCYSLLKNWTGPG